MPELPHQLIAALTGFIAGILLCIPVGPVNITIVNEGARRGFKWAALIGIGATAMEVLYCTIAFTGFASFFQRGMIKSLMEVFSVAFMLFLGVRYLFARPGPVLEKLEHKMEKLEHRIEERIEEKLHPHSAFMIGFVRTLANPAVLLGWIFLGALFMARGWVRPDLEGKLYCVLGVTVSVALWFTGLSWAISRGHKKKFTEATLIKMERISGVSLIIFGLAQGIHLAMKLAK